MANLHTKTKNFFSHLLLSCLLLFFTPLVFAGKSPVATATITPSTDEIQAIVKRGKLVVAMYSEDTPPFYYTNHKHELVGVDVALIKGFANLLGVKTVEFDRSAKFLDDVVDKVESHQADVGICKLSITFSRVKRVLFTKPYIPLHQSLLVNRLLLAHQLHGRSKEEVIQHLSGKIGVVAKSSYVKYAKEKFKQAEIIEYPTWNETVSDVIKGKIIAAYRDEAAVKMVIRDKPDAAIQLFSVVLKDALDPKGIAISVEHRHLKDLLDFYIDSLALNLTADKVLTDYDNVIKTIENRTR